MFRKSIVLLSVCLATLVFMPSATMAQDGNKVYCDPAHDTECSVSASQELIITNHWGACRRGLVPAFLVAIEAQEYTLTAPGGNGVVWHLGTEAAQDLWGPTQEFWDDALHFCIGQVSTGYISYWEYEPELVDLEPGDYTLHFTLSLEHPVVDGIDLDGDGRPDQYNGQLADRAVTIHILAD